MELDGPTKSSSALVSLDEDDNIGNDVANVRPVRLNDDMQIPVCKSLFSVSFLGCPYSHLSLLTVNRKN